jgi:N-acyl-D-glutamate deacylase
MKRIATFLLLLIVLLCLPLGLLAQTGDSATIYDIVIVHGRVIDPETKLDAVRNVGIIGGKIAAVSEAALKGRTTIDATGLIVSPGFVDWHTHGQNTLSDRMQAFDGVTTTLELELGALPVSRWYEQQAASHRVLNYGASASWAAARIETMEGGTLPERQSLRTMLPYFGMKKWTSDIATPEQAAKIVGLLDESLQEGAIGVGLPLGYSPGSGYKELLAVHQLAAKYNVPVTVHVRSEGDVDPLSAAQAYGEVLSYAAATGASVHICHLNSTSFGDMPLAVDMLHHALDKGLHVTVEAYPYGAGSTGVGAKFLSPENLPRMGMTPESVEYLGKRLDKRSLEELRAKDPGAMVIMHYYELPRDQKLLDDAVLFPGGIIASDSMPWINAKTGQPVDADAWPIPEDAFAHPRGAATFTHFLAEYVRERKLVSWPDAIAKVSYWPAKMLGESVPQMQKKGRLQAGMDADVTVFDPATVQGRATFAKPNQTSVGVKYLLVNGTVVIRDGELDTKAFPGQAIRREVTK